MKTSNLKKGQLGESIARDYLQEKGYKIIEQNYRTKYAEIDLVAAKAGSLVFIEVKTRLGENFGIPEDSLNRNKMNRLIRNANAYMAREKKFKKYRIDAICIVLENGGYTKRITHHENITF